MVFITPISSAAAQAARKTKRKEASSASGFSGYMNEAEETDSAARAASASPISASNPLLGAQEISDDSLARKQAVRRGHSSLDMLEEIRIALMCGGVPLNMLHGIEALLRQERAAQPDPALQDILDEIEVRVAVEHAKLEMALHRPDA